MQLFQIFKLNFYTCDEKRKRFATISGRESGKIVKRGPNSIRWLPKMCRFAGKVLPQFKLSTFNGTAPTVQNYHFVGFWKVLSYKQCCCEFEFERTLEKCQKHSASRRASGTSVMFFQIPACIKSP